MSERSRRDAEWRPRFEGIYVIEMVTGHVKIGRSGSVVDRLRAHADHMRVYGAEAVNVWTSSVANSEECERLLKRMLLAHDTAQPTNKGLETWTEVTFIEVVTVATALFRDRLKFKLADLPHPADVQTSGPVLRQRARDGSPDDSWRRSYAVELLEQLTYACGDRPALPLAEANKYLFHEYDRSVLRGLVKRQWVPQEDGKGETPGYLLADLDSALDSILVRADDEALNMDEVS